MVVVLVMSGDASAAELRGRIREHGSNRAAAGSVVHAVCGGTSKSAGLTGDGSYSIRGLPSGQTCELWVKMGSRVSARVPFTTRGPVARFSGQIRLRGNGLILMPD